MPPAATAKIQPGTMVEIHSLAAAELNGLHGEAGEYDADKGRRAVHLLLDGRLLGVKVAPPSPPSDLCIGRAL